MVKGMKQTEIGMIPEDWEVIRLGDYSTLKNGFAFPSIAFSNKGPIVMTPGNFKLGGGLKFNGDKIIRFKGTFTKNMQLLNGDLVMVMTDLTPDCNLLGKAGIINTDEVVLHNQRIGKVECSKYIHSEYLCYYFNSEPFSARMKNTATGSTVRHTSTPTIKNTVLPLPPLPEQEAIAVALSDADAWIESLEQLIAKKRLIKQGARQELLTPKEGWEMKTIFEIADNKRDLFNDGDWIESEHIVDEGIRLVQTGNIGIGKFLNKANRKYINELSFNKLKCKELREGDLLICRLAEPAGRACLFPKTDDYKSVTSVDVTIYRPDVQKYDRRFLLFSLSTDHWFTDVIEQVGGTTHKRISRGNLGRIKISVPQLTEQTRIATILSDMDAELEALEQQLHKARQIKQGMMQELLTGRVRLEL